MIIFTKLKNLMWLACTLQQTEVANLWAQQPITQVLKHDTS